MDINTEMTDLIFIWIFGLADVVLIAIVGYGIYLFRKSICEFENRNTNSKLK